MVLANEVQPAMLEIRVRVWKCIIYWTCVLKRSIYLPSVLLGLVINLEGNLLDLLVWLD